MNAGSCVEAMKLFGLKATVLWSMLINGVTVLDHLHNGSPLLRL